MAEMPMEYSDELTSSLLDKLKRGISQTERVRVGQARSEALARGLEGDMTEASLVGRARSDADQATADTETNFRYQLADLARQERLTGEERQFQSGEAQKDRDFRERMARIGYEWERDNEALANRRAYQGALWGTGARVGSALLTKGLGGLL